MTKAEIRAIWEKAPGLTVGPMFDDELDCWCAVNSVNVAVGSARKAFVSAGIDVHRTVVENDAFEGTPQERRDHMIALLDAGKLDA